LFDAVDAAAVVVLLLLLAADADVLCTRLNDRINRCHYSNVIAAAAVTADFGVLL